MTPRDDDEINQQASHFKRMQSEMLNALFREVFEDHHDEPVDSVIEALQDAVGDLAQFSDEELQIYAEIISGGRMVPSFGGD